MILRDIKRLLGTFLILATSFFASSVPVSALQLSELEPKISADAKVELNEAESPYDFDVTLLDKNRTVEYDATITNDSTYDIEINSVEINNSNYDFLEYSFDGIGGKLALSDSAINTTGTTNYGAYIKDGELTLQNSIISATGTTSYGAYISNGDLVMGEPEPVDSPNYGTENANVSTTSPSIKAIGTTSGIGVYKDLGKFKFYDGIITASTSAIPRDNITTDVEHLYEPTFHTDAYGNDVCILTWMRDLPSQPGN